MSGGGRAWEGGRGRGHSQPAPAAPDRTRNSSRTEAGETEKERDTYRDRELHTAKKGKGCTHLAIETPPPHIHALTRARARWAEGCKSELNFTAFSTPAFVLNHLCLQRSPRSLLTDPFSPQSSRRGW